MSLLAARRGQTSSAKRVSSGAADVRGELAVQMERAVQWTGTVQTMRAAGIASFVEMGPGSVLSALVKRIDREAVCRSIADLDLDLPFDKPA